AICRKSFIYGLLFTFFCLFCFSRVILTVKRASPLFGSLPPVPAALRASGTLAGRIPVFFY
ncbi:hypothetical protein D3Z55_22985, partial [Clostridiaceae bacterium]|nr:hypothetical protein [Clostridiaceae bacterium]